MFPFILLAVESPEDADFLCKLYTDYHRLMYATAGKFTSSQEDKEDIVQDALVKMVKYVAYLRKLDGCTLPSAVVILTRNTAINFARHRSIVQKHTSPSGWDPDEIPPGSDVSTVEDMVALSEMRNGLDTIWPKLSENDRILLEGRYILGLSDDELAEFVGCKPSSVRMKLTRARRNALAEMKRIDFCYDQS